MIQIVILQDFLQYYGIAVFFFDSFLQFLSMDLMEFRFFPANFMSLLRGHRQNDTLKCISLAILCIYLQKCRIQLHLLYFMKKNAYNNV